VDTRHVEVAEKSLDYGIHWINDVTGLDNKNMRKLVAQMPVNCIVMHHLSIPEQRNNILPRDQDPVNLVYEWGKQRLEMLLQEGIALEKIIFDPGIGFGKMAEQSLLLIKSISIFSQLNVPLLVGHSRKTFLSFLSGLPYCERDVETTAISVYLSKQKVDYLRIHNVDMTTRAFKVTAALEND
jgi:dihydropteroate synthase